MNSLMIAHSAASTSVTTPDKAALAITGDVIFEVMIAPFAWSGVYQQVAGQRDSSGIPDSGPTFRINVDGKWEFYAGVGGSFVEAISTVASGFSAGQRAIVRIVRVGSVVQFLYSLDGGSSFTQLGANAALAGSMNNSTQAFRIGCSSDGSEQFTGEIFYVKVTNSSGTVVLFADFRGLAKGTRSFADGLGNTFTVNASAEVVVSDADAGVNSLLAV